MPLLSESHVQELLELAQLHRRCNDCGQRGAQDYCRTCDEFYWLHAPGCVMYETKHFGHRLTIVPFVEDRGANRTEPIPIRFEPDLKVFFFPNGTTGVTRDGRQVEELQQSWLRLFAEFLESRGEDPAAFMLVMPSGKEARFCRASDGLWNWEFR